jgi:hypothetical protein
LREMGLELPGHPVKILGIGRRITFYRDIGPFRRILGIDFEPFLKARFGIGFYGICGAFWLANTAINALIGVDDQHVFTLVETVHGTDFNAVHVFALDAVFSDNVGHSGPVVL